MRFGRKCIAEGCDNYDAEWKVIFVLTPEGGMCMTCWNAHNGGRLVLTPSPHNGSSDRPVILCEHCGQRCRFKVQAYWADMQICPPCCQAFAAAFDKKGWPKTPWKE